MWLKKVATWVLPELKLSSRLGLDDHECLNQTLCSMGLFGCSRYDDRCFRCSRLRLRNCNFCIRNLKRILVMLKSLLPTKVFWLVPMGSNVHQKSKNKKSGLWKKRKIGFKDAPHKFVLNIHHLLHKFPEQRNEVQPLQLWC